MDEIKLKQYGDNSVQIGENKGTVNITLSVPAFEAVQKQPQSLSPGESKKRDDSRYYVLIDKILKQQKDSGEIGAFREPSVVNVSRPYKDSIAPDKRANIYPTMSAVNLLTNHPVHSKTIKKAIEWLYGLIDDDGYFCTTAEMPVPVKNFVTGENRLYDLPIRNYRHMGEILVALLTTGQINDVTLKLLRNLLKAENTDGGWSDIDITKESMLFSTTFILQALNHSNLPCLYSLLPEQQAEALSRDVSAAKKNAFNWLLECNKDCGGFWYKPDVEIKGKYLYTGVIIGSLSEQLLADAPSFTHRLVERIMSERVNNLWLKDDGQIDYVNSTVLLSALLGLRNAGMDIEIGNFEETKNQLWDYYQQDIDIDAGALCSAENVYSF